MSVFRFNPEAGPIRIPVLAANERGDERIVNLALDPGSGVSTMPSWLIADLRLSPAADTPADITTASNETSVQFFLVPRLTVLGIDIHGAEVANLDLPSKASVEGLLGLSCLRNFKLFLNFPKGKLALLHNNSGIFRRSLEPFQVMWVYW